MSSPDMSSPDYWLYSKIIPEILARASESVLDIGGGRGEVVKILLENGIKATCMEVSEDCWTDRVTDAFILHSALEIPWPFVDKQFDLCTGFGVLKYVSAGKLESVLYEIARVTRRGFFGVGRGIKNPPSDSGKIELDESADWWFTKFTELIPSYPVETLPMDQLDPRMEETVAKTISLVEKEKINAGRNLVGAYRTAHSKLYDHGPRKGIPEEHTPLLNVLKNGLNSLGFESLNEFFSKSDELEDEWK